MSLRIKCILSKYTQQIKFLSGNVWQLQERLNPDGSIPAINRCIYPDFDPVFAQQMTQMQGLGDWWKEQAIEYLYVLTVGEKPKEHWTT